MSKTKAKKDIEIELRFTPKPEVLDRLSEVFDILLAEAGTSAEDQAGPPSSVVIAPSSVKNN